MFRFFKGKNVLMHTFWKSSIFWGGMALGGMVIFLSGYFFDPSGSAELFGGYWPPPSMQHKIAVFIRIGAVFGAIPFSLFLHYKYRKNKKSPKPYASDEYF